MAELSDIGIEEIKVEANRPGEPLDMCAYCNLKITIRGTGVLVEKAGIVCDNPGETMIDQGICKTCVLDTTTGLYLATDAGGDCSCTRQNLGFAVCGKTSEEHTICTDEFGKPEIVKWTDPENQCADCLLPEFKDTGKCQMTFFAGE